MQLKLSHKLIALVLLSSIVPLCAVSTLLIDIGRRHVESTVEQVHQLEANAAASRVTRFLQRAQELLVADLEGSLETMPDADVHLALVWMLGKQDNLLLFRALQVYDSTGHPIGGQAVRLPASSIPEDQQAHFLVSDADVAMFERNTPLQAALISGETQLSEVYVNAARNEALVAMAAPIKDRFRQVVGVVTAELSLREVQRTVSDVTLGTVGHAFLVDAEGHAVAHPQQDLVSRHALLSNSPIVAEALRTRRPGTLAFPSEADGVAQLGAFAPVFWGGWQLVVQQPAADAYRAVATMKQRAAFILAVALIASLVGSLLAVRSLTTPLREVVDGMRRVVDGNMDHRLAIRTGDEIGELARAFNVMGTMLQAHQAEIRAWNAELQSRVEAKTKALESAQAQLVQSAKRSSLGQLGAGVAHELNNPLTGVVGQAALLRRRLRKTDLPEAERAKLDSYVAHIESESSRCREIIHGLLSFSQASEAGTDQVDLNACVERIMLLVGSAVRTAGVEVRTELDRTLPTVMANEHQLQQVFMNLITNAQQAMPDGGSLVITSRLADGEVCVDVTDTGRGIAAEHLDQVFDPFFTTKDVWQNTGLGLSVVWSLVEAHGGRVEVQSTPGKGSTFTLILPQGRKPAAQGRSGSVAEPGAQAGARRRPAGVGA